MGKVRGFWHRKARWQKVTKLMARDGTSCAICGVPVERSIKDHEDSKYITFDHIIPRSKGGNDSMSNLRLAHRLCNMERGNDPILPEEEEMRIAQH